MTWLSQLLSVMSQPFQWWVVVAPWEQALRIRLGKVAALLGPGVHLRIPFFDRVYRQSLRRRMLDSTGQTLTSRDGRVVTISIAVEYEVSDLRQLYSTLASPESMLLMLVQTKIAAHVAATPSGELTPGSIDAAATPTADECAAWGLSGAQAHVIAFAFVKTYRFLTNDYRSFTGLDTDTWDGKPR